MEISSPLCITSRLLPGVRIGGAEISIEYYCQNHGRQYYRWYINLNGLEETGSGLALVIGSTLQEGLEALLSFLGAFAEDALLDDFGSAGDKLFPSQIASWAVKNADAIAMLEMELHEHPNQLIVE